MSVLSNLFIPRKGQPSYVAQDNNTQMLAIERWSKTLTDDILMTALGGSAFTFGSSPPQGTPLFTQADLFEVTCVAGLATVTLRTPFQYGYVAVVCSGFDAFAQVVSLVPAGASLAQFPVMCYTLATGAVTGTAFVSYQAVGA